MDLFFLKILPFLIMISGLLRYLLAAMSTTSPACNLKPYVISPRISAI